MNEEEMNNENEQDLFDYDFDELEKKFESIEKGTYKLVENGITKISINETIDENNPVSKMINSIPLNELDRIKHLKSGDTGTLIYLKNPFSTRIYNNSINYGVDSSELYFKVTTLNISNISCDLKILLIDKNNPSSFKEIHSSGMSTHNYLKDKTNKVFSNINVFDIDSEEHSKVLELEIECNNIHENKASQKAIDNFNDYRTRKYKSLLEKYKLDKAFQETDNILSEVCNFAFEENNWEFVKNITSNSNEFLPSSEFNNRLTIKFPEIEISNTSKQKHLIRDFYLSIFFNKEMRISSTLYGRRGQYSPEEFYVNYGHSHMQTDKYCWQQMCLGTDTPLKFLTTSMSMNHTFNKETMYKLVLLIKSYVCWESKEGNPYISIDTLPKSNSRIPNVINDINSIDDFNKKLKLMINKDNSIINVNKINSFNRFKCDIDKIEEVLMTKNLNNYFTSDKICYKTGDNKYFYQSEETGSYNNPSTIERYNRDMEDNCRNRESRKIYFKGEKIVPKIISSLTNNDNTKKCLNPHLLKAGVAKFEEELNKYYLNITKQYELTTINESTL